jgi:competence protein ComEC
MPDLKDIESPNPLVIPALVWILGLLAGFYFFSGSFPANIYLIFGLFGFSVLLFLAVSNKIFKTVSLLVLIMLLGFARASLSQVKPDNHISHFIPDKDVIIQPIAAKIVGHPSIRTGQYGKYYTVHAEMERIGGYETAGKVQISIPEDFISDPTVELMPGLLLSFHAELSSYRSRRGFSRIPEPYFRTRSVPSAQVRPRSLVRVEARTGQDDSFFSRLGSNYRKNVYRLRLSIIERIDQRFAAEGAGLVKAMLLGDRNEVFELQQVLVRGGIAHLLAISGLHLAIITLIVHTLLSIFLIRRTPAKIIIIILVLLYGELCGWTPSISRAGMMIILLMITGILQRKPCYNNILAMSIIIITAINPAQIFSVGLQLSFISMFAIINILPHLDRLIDEKVFAKTKYKPKGILLRLIQVFTITAAITVMITPLTLYYFNQFSLNGLIGNILGIPILGLIIPLSLLIIILPEIPILLLFYQETFTFTTSAFQLWSSFSASLPLYFNFISFSFYQLIALYLVIYLFISQYLRAKKTLTEDERKKGAGRVVSSKKRYKRYLAPAVMVILLIVVIFPSLLFRSSLLTVTFFDVGHGDCFFVETATGERIMIDTGPVAKSSTHISTSVFPYLQQQGIKTIDLLVITHPHNDHFGGLQYLVNNLNVEKVMLTEHFTTTDEWAAIYEYLESSNAQIHIVSDTTHIAFDEVMLKIIHPDMEFSSLSYNDMSIVISMDYRDFSVLFTGDLEWEGEQYLVNKYPSYLSALVLKVAHHGSNTSSSEIFLKAVEADYAFIPAARGGRFSFPHPEVSERLAVFIDERYIFNAADQGSLQFKTDGMTSRIRTFGSR